MAFLGSAYLGGTEGSPDSGTVFNSGVGFFLSSKSKNRGKSPMTNQATEDIVKQFVSQLTIQWDDLVVEYSYDTREDVWDIWHFNYGLQYNDMNFQKSAGKLVRTLFFNQGIFNISFGYKHTPVLPKQ